MKPRLVPRNLRQSGRGRTTPEMMIHPKTRKGPYWHLSDRHGCWSYSTHSNMYRPRCYVPQSEGGLYKEYEYLTEHVTLWDAATERMIQLKGRDALRFCDLVTTRSMLDKLPVGQARFALMCFENGNILVDPVVLRVAEDEIWLSTHTEVEPWCRGLLYGLDYDVTANEIDVSPVQIQGPNSRLLIEKIVRKGIISPEVLDLKFYKCCHTKFNDLDVLVSRTGYSSEFGYEFFLYDATRNADALWDVLVSEGEEFNLMVTAPSMIRALEAGIPWNGVDFDTETNPFEVGLDRYVDLDKDDFIGRDALLQIKADGVEQKLIGLTFDGEPLRWFNPDYFLLTDAFGKDAGYCTHAFYSPQLKRNIAHAIVEPSLSEPGTKLQVKVSLDAALLPAEVVATPFYDPKKNR
ncbi:MAG: aminomethyltransferase family protein [Methyloligellaceae bacterium]